MAEKNTSNKPKKNNSEDHESSDAFELKHYTADAWNNLRKTWIEYLKIIKHLSKNNDDAQKEGLKKQGLQLQKTLDQLLSDLKLPANNYRNVESLEYTGFDSRNILDESCELKEKHHEC